MLTYIPEIKDETDRVQPVPVGRNDTGGDLDSLLSWLSDDAAWPTPPLDVDDRRTPFLRLLVREFEFLFVSDENHPVEGDALSRRVLPGFFAATRLMLGPEYRDGAERLCQGIMDAERPCSQILDPKAGPGHVWDLFYESGDGLWVLLETLAPLARYFKSPAKRLDWFVDLVNSRTDRPVNLGGEDSAQWRLTHRGAAIMWRALFAKLRRSLASSPSRELLALRLGVDAVDAAEKALQGLDHYTLGED